jgi:hypothetical protein
MWKQATISDAKKMCDKRDMGVLSLEKIVESDAVTDVLESLGLIQFYFARVMNIYLINKQDCPPTQF